MSYERIEINPEGGATKEFKEEDCKNNSEKNIENLKQKLEGKKIELEDEERFYRDNRNNPHKSDSDWSALDMSQNTRKKLEKEIEELEEKIKE